MLLAMTAKRIISRYGSDAALSCLIGLALVLRLWGIGDQSFWLDEAFSVVHARAGLMHILSSGFEWETNPPLYYMLVEIWTSLFGDSEAAARSLSALIGAATVPVIFAIGRKLLSPGAGFVAALLFAIAILQIDYGQEARQYALLVLALSVALLGAVMALADRADDDMPPRRAGILFTGGIVIAVYSHDIAIFYWAALDLSLLLALLLAPPSPGLPRFFVHWAGYNLIALLFTAPQLYAIWHLRAAPAVDWLPPPSLGFIAAVVQSLLFSEFARAWPVGTLGAIVAVAAIVWATIVNRRSPPAICFGLVLSLLSFALIVGVSLARPVMLVRTTLWVPVPLYVFLGVAIGALRCPRSKAVALAALVLFAGLGAFVDRQHYAKEPWREIVPSIARQFRGGDVVVFVTPSIHPFAYYWPGGFDFARCRRPELNVSPGPPVGDQLKYRCQTESVPDILRELPPGGSAWFISRYSAVPMLTDLAYALSESYDVGARTWMSNHDRPILLVRVAARTRQ
jgi:4-amino-4-deoxy-L-arabinose transferase-like glycosyltransferase